MCRSMRAALRLASRTNPRYSCFRQREVRPAAHDKSHGGVPANRRDFPQRGVAAVAVRLGRADTSECARSVAPDRVARASRAAKPVRKFTPDAAVADESPLLARNEARA